MSQCMLEMFGSITISYHMRTDRLLSPMLQQTAPFSSSNSVCCVGIAPELGPRPKYSGPNAQNRWADQPTNGLIDCKQRLAGNAIFFHSRTQKRWSSRDSTSSRLTIPPRVRQHATSNSAPSSDVIRRILDSENILAIAKTS